MPNPARLFTYILKHDSGFAPNPFWGHCTLACCKPAIRRTAAVGDVTPKHRGNRIAYFMEIAEILPSFADYWRDPRFAPKKPVWEGPERMERQGDNCYEPDGSGEYRQLPSEHSKRDGTESIRAKRRDLSGRRVLIATRFGYFGRDARPLRPDLSFGVVGRAHRCRFTADQVDRFLQFLDTLPTGVHGVPERWQDGAASYQQNLAVSRPRSCR